MSFYDDNKQNLFSDETKYKGFKFRKKGCLNKMTYGSNVNYKTWNNSIDEGSKAILEQVDSIKEESCRYGYDKGEGENYSKNKIKELECKMCNLNQIVKQLQDPCKDLEYPETTDKSYKDIDFNPCFSVCSERQDPCQLASTNNKFDEHWNYISGLSENSPPLCETFRECYSEKIPSSLGEPVGRGFLLNNTNKNNPTDFTNQKNSLRECCIVEENSCESKSCHEIKLDDILNDNRKNALLERVRLNANKDVTAEQYNDINKDSNCSNRSYKKSLKEQCKPNLNNNFTSIPSEEILLDKVHNNKHCTKYLLEQCTPELQKNMYENQAKCFCTKSFNTQFTNCERIATDKKFQNITEKQNELHNEIRRLEKMKMCLSSNQKEKDKICYKLQEMEQCTLNLENQLKKCRTETENQKCFIKSLKKMFQENNFNFDKKVMKKENSCSASDSCISILDKARCQIKTLQGKICQQEKINRVLKQCLCKQKKMLCEQEKMKKECLKSKFNSIKYYKIFLFLIAAILFFLFIICSV